MKSLKRSFLVKFTTGVVAASLALAAPMAGEARAQVAAAPLDGETLVALVTGNPFDVDVGTIDITADCIGGPSGQPTISYTATGPAFGPYPGTYQESGTATLADSFLTSKPLVSFSAEFTISSPVGLVTGTKEMFHPASAGACFGATTPTGHAVFIHDFTAFLTTYEATITTPEGTCTTSGSASVTVSERDAPSQLLIDRHEFREVFLTSTPCVVPWLPDDDDCKESGWMTRARADDSTFKNQGDCIQYVNTGE